MNVHPIGVKRLTVETVLALISRGYALMPVVHCDACGLDRAAFGEHLCRPDEATHLSLLNLTADTVHPTPDALHRIRTKTTLQKETPHV